MFDMLIRSFIFSKKKTKKRKKTWKKEKEINHICILIWNEYVDFISIFSSCFDDYIYTKKWTFIVLIFYFVRMTVKEKECLVYRIYRRWYLICIEYPSEFKWKINTWTHGACWEANLMFRKMSVELFLWLYLLIL